MSGSTGPQHGALGSSVGLLSLASELLQDIFSYCTSTKDLLSVSRTCRVLHGEAAPLLYRTITLKIEYNKGLDLEKTACLISQKSNNLSFVRAVEIVGNAGRKNGRWEIQKSDSEIAHERHLSELAARRILDVLETLQPGQIRKFVWKTDIQLTDEILEHLKSQQSQIEAFVLDMHMVDEGVNHDALSLLLRKLELKEFDVCLSTLDLACLVIDSIIKRHSNSLQRLKINLSLELAASMNKTIEYDNSDSENEARSKSSKKPMEILQDRLKRRSVRLTNVKALDVRCPYVNTNGIFQLLPTICSPETLTSLKTIGCGDINRTLFSSPSFSNFQLSVLHLELKSDFELGLQYLAQTQNLIELELRLNTWKQALTRRGWSGTVEPDNGDTAICPRYPRFGENFSRLKRLRMDFPYRYCRGCIIEEKQEPVPREVMQDLARLPQLEELACYPANEPLQTSPDEFPSLRIWWLLGETLAYKMWVLNGTHDKAHIEDQARQKILKFFSVNEPPRKLGMIGFGGGLKKFRGDIFVKILETPKYKSSPPPQNALSLEFVGLDDLRNWYPNLDIFDRLDLNDF